MGRRGPKSAEALAVPSPTAILARPDACYSLTDEQSEIWRATLEALPADWIETGGLPVLAAFCRTTTALRRLGQLVTQMETEAGPIDIAAYTGLLAAHAKQAQTLKTLSTALRLTPQTRLKSESAARKAGQGVGPRPWDRF